MSFIQSIMFDAKSYTPDKARAWLKKRGYNAIKRVDRTAKYLRYRIREPDASRFEYRIGNFGRNIRVVLGFAKRRSR